jgi:hypothetical protein
MITVPLHLRGPVDMHVHLVGNGLSGSGCWLKPPFLHRFLADWMLRQLGLKVSWRAPEFDDAYVNLLTSWLRDSPVSHAVLLAHEEVYDHSGQKLNFGSLHVPNDYVFAVCRRHPELLPAVSIHPARPDALDELDRCLDLGAVMLKFLPNCQNIDSRLPAYRPFWNRMAAAKLPLLAHSGGEHTVPQIDPSLADPRSLTGALEAGVTVIAAHAATRSGLRDPDYLDHLLEMMPRWPNLFADISALNLPVRSAGLARLLKLPEWHHRLFHGSDFPVPIQPSWARFRGILPAHAARHWASIPNFLHRDFGLKSALGFPEHVFTGIWQHLRVAA